MDIKYQRVSVGFSNSFFLKGWLDQWRHSNLVKFLLKGRLTQQAGKEMPGYTQHWSKRLFFKGKACQVALQY